MRKKIIFIFSIIFIICSFRVYANEQVEKVIEDTAKCVYNNAQNPTVSSIGGEWAIIGLARSNTDIPEAYYNKYYENAEEYVKNKSGILSEKKYTEYSRLILALASIGKNPADIGGYNIIKPLADFEKTVYQGINGAIYALIALDSGAYKIPENDVADIKATREMYVNYILDKQKADGGWALTDNDEKADVDITAMVLQALSSYNDRNEVKNACDRGIAFLSASQNENAGYVTWGSENAESCAQVIVALCELGISPYEADFVKNEKTLVDNLLSFYIEGQGFKHSLDDDKTNQMSTEQALYSLVSLNRFESGKNTLYKMTDVMKSNTEKSIGLPSKNPDVSIPDISADYVVFTDIAGHKNEQAINMLSKRKIINGKDVGIFDPNGTMTRAEFATIIVNGLSLPIKETKKFIDVKKNDWFYSFVNTAYCYGIVKGVSDNEYNPQGTITKEEASVMVARTAKLCGMNTELSEQEIRDILSGFTDYTKSSDWAKSSLALLYKNNILDNDDIEIEPKVSVKRSEIAQMLAKLLIKAKLIQE